MEGAGRERELTGGNAWKFFLLGLPRKVGVNLSPTCYCERYDELCLALCVVTYYLKWERAHNAT